MNQRFRLTSALIVAACVVTAYAAPGLCAEGHRATVGPRLDRAMRADVAEKLAGGDGGLTVWVYLRDKGPGATKGIVPQHVVSERSLRRRAKVLPPDRLVDAHDLPVHGAYVDDIAGRVVRLRQRSKWFNAVSVEATPAQVEALRSLPFVRHLDLVLRQARRHDLRTHDVDSSALVTSPGATATPGKPSVPLRYDYGISFNQLEISNITLMHSLGYDGSGVLVGHFDNGHRLLSHEVFDHLDVAGSWDFVDHDPDTAPDPTDPPSWGGHGVVTLSVLAGFKETRVIGPAYASSYLLARTENDGTESPLEEDNWVAAIEWADSLGVDVTSTSLGYRDFEEGFRDWTWEDMDGNTTVITRAADMAAARGIVVVAGVGNNGFDVVGEIENTMLAPADGDDVIAVGAVDDVGKRAGFSSYGPTADGRTKPDVMAHGSGTAIAQAGNEAAYGFGGGTSLATPIVAGTVALLLQAHPWATPSQIRDALRETASRADAVDRHEGWGIIDAYAAFVYLRNIAPPAENPFAGWPAYVVPHVLAVLPTGTIQYKLANDAHVTLQVFDVRGRLVRSLVSSPQTAQLHEVSWNGRDDRGTAAGSGVFFVRLQTRPLQRPGDVATFTRKLVRLD